MKKLDFKETFIEVNIDSVSELFDFYMKPQIFFGNRYSEVFQDSKHIPERMAKFFTDTDYFDPWAQFVFRGQSNKIWPLETSLYRHSERSGGKNKANELQKLERMALREFQRQYKRLENQHIDSNAYHEWFAVMQHYGAPTRLLDFTYSFYVALYFASKDASFLDIDVPINFTIFAVNYLFVEFKRNVFLTPEIELLVDGAEGDSQMKTPNIQKLTVEKLAEKGVLLVTPFYLNARLVRQRGTFLMPTDLNSCFMDNLNKILVGEDGCPLNNKVIRMNISLSFQELHFLYRQLNYMNISAPTLFEDNLVTLGEAVKMKMFTAKYTDMLADNKQGIIKGSY